jgi:hypothetical protein
MITYNHMLDDAAEKSKNPAAGNFASKNRLTLIFIAEELLIATLLALIFYMI